MLNFPIKHFAPNLRRSPYGTTAATVEAGDVNTLRD